MDVSSWSSTVDGNFSVGNKHTSLSFRPLEVTERARALGESGQLIALVPSPGREAHAARPVARKRGSVVRNQVKVRTCS
jgi:hypothetical protein